MPEGDTVHGMTDRIRDRIGGRTLRRSGGTASTLRRHGHRLRGARVNGVAAVGKHLLIDFEGGWTLRVHLGMTGHWRLGPATGRRGDGAARAVLETGEWALRCYAAPSVRLERSAAARAAVAHLGPDLATPAPDIEEAIARARRRDDGTTLSELLLDQTVAAGIGNVYRNEVLFEAGIHPSTEIGRMDDDALGWILTRASRHLRLNTGRRRTTTGARGVARSLYVYGRAGRPCRRCGTRLRTARTSGRSSFWCPACQPAPPLHEP